MGIPTDHASTYLSDLDSKSDVGAELKKETKTTKIDNKRCASSIQGYVCSIGASKREIARDRIGWTEDDR